MEYFVLLGLLLIKHTVLSNFLDVGYSKSRMADISRPWLWFIFQGVLELTASTYLLLSYGWWAVIVAWGVEASALGAGCYLERRATVSRLLVYHLLGESMACLAYGVITALVVFKAF